MRERYARGAAVLLVMCSRLSTEKRPGDALEALAHLRASEVDARLVVAGDGPLRGRLSTQARAARLLGLPWPLARPLGRRMRALNDAVHALSVHHGALRLHAAARPWSTAPGTLSADRLHPSETGHRLLARDFHALLAAEGLATWPAPRPDPDRPPPGRSASAWWTATRGTKWVADRCRDLLPDLLRLAAEEYRHETRGTAPLLDLASQEATTRALEALGLARVGAEVPADVAAPAGDYRSRGGRTSTNRTGVPGGDWAAAASATSGTTPITG